MLAALPAVALLIAGGVSPTSQSSAVALLVGALGTVVSAVVRDRGSRLQDGLFDSWGGAPTTQRLRRRANAHDLLVDRHAHIAEVTGAAPPTAAQEAADPEASDRRYGQAVDALRTLTQKDADFPRVADENANYGFRRNALGLRPWA